MTRVWSLLRPLLPAEARFSTGILVVCSLLAGILEAALLIVVVSAALAVAGDQGGTHLDLAIFRVDVDVEVALIIAACAGAMSLLLHLMTARITADLSAGVLCTARTRAVNGFASASWARQANEREGSLQETVSTLSMQSSALVVVLANLLAALLSLGALFLAAMVLDPIVTVVVIAFGAVLFLVVKPLGSLTQRRAENFVRENSRFAERISQWGSLAMELRVFGVEQSEASRLREHNEATTQALGHMRFISRAGALLYRDLAVLFLIGAIVALHIVSSVDLASFGAVILLIVRALTYAQAAQSNMQQLREQEPSLVALVTRLESLESARDAFGNMAVSAVAPIDLRGVTYDYGHGRNGVTDIDLQIARGEAVGIVGPSGGGKTTLAQILLRLRTPTRGRILVAGTPYGEIAEESWSRLVALVPQEPKLAEGTVADNIRFFRDHISDLDVEGAAAKAHVLDDIRLLPLGFETELGPRGTGLSGGQKQRVAIARALVGHPLLLVLDEPTSALDNRSEELLRDTITELKGDVTLVIIAHRLSTLEVCDRIIGIESGRLRTFRSLREAAEQVQG